MPLPCLFSASKQLRILFHGRLDLHSVFPGFDLGMVLWSYPFDVLVPVDCQSSEVSSQRSLQLLNLLTALACKYFSFGENKYTSRGLRCNTGLSMYTLLPQATAVANARRLVPNRNLDQSILATCSLLYEAEKHMYAMCKMLWVAHGMA